MYQRKLAELEELLRKYNYETDFLDKFVLKSERKKERVNAIFGLTKENNYRHTFPFKTDNAALKSEYGYLFDEISQYFITNDIDVTFDWAENKVHLGENKVMKITKFLAKHPKLIHILGNDVLYCLESQVLPKLGEIFTNSTDWVFVLSSNVFDYLTNAAENADLATFSSCFDITENNYNTKSGHGGCHANGGNGYALDDFTLLLYIAHKDNLDRKCGRGWVHVPEGIDDTAMVCLSGLYGKMNCNFIMSKQALSYITSVVNPQQTWKINSRNEYPWTYENAGCIAPTNDEHDNYAVYFNGYEYEIYIAHYGRTHIEELPRYVLTFSGAMCLECGCMTNHARNLSCDSCDQKMYRCFYCGAETNYEQTDALGHTYCIDCDHYTCATCGKYVPRSHMYSFENNLYCRNHLPARCGLCRKIFLQDQLEFRHNPLLGVYDNFCSACVATFVNVTPEPAVQADAPDHPSDARNIHDFIYWRNDELQH